MKTSSSIALNYLVIVMFLDGVSTVQNRLRSFLQYHREFDELVNDNEDESNIIGFQTISDDSSDEEIVRPYKHRAVPLIEYDSERENDSGGQNITNGNSFDVDQDFDVLQINTCCSKKYRTIVSAQYLITQVNTTGALVLPTSLGKNSKMDPFVGDIYYDNEQNDRTDALLLHLRVPENRFRFFPLKIPKGGFHRIGQALHSENDYSFEIVSPDVFPVKVNFVQKFSTLNLKIADHCEFRTREQKYRYIVDN
ncbi:hypothetical protein C0J52_11495 [Blattella germanica]|nr:hypothetical protein C0J52_11495 [Blattella germanica]